MSLPERIRVLGRGGVRGFVISSPSVLERGGYKVISLENGQRYRVPSNLLALNQDGTYRLDAGLQELQQFAASPARRAVATPNPKPQKAVTPSSALREEQRSRTILPHGSGAPLAPQPEPERAPRLEEVAMPVIEEEAVVGKRKRDTARIRVRRKVTHREVQVDEPFFQEAYEIKRVPINSFIEEPVGPRTEGDTLIVPVLEEVVTIEKRLMLREEVHIIRRREQIQTAQKVTLRKEEVDVERFELESEGEEKANG